MITLLHGDNVVASRKALEKLKLSNKGSEILFLSGQASLADLKQALESSSMFSASRLVVFEGLLSSRSSKEQLDYLASGQFGADLVLWERKQISPGTIKKLGSQVRVKLFKIPALVFRFLDSFGSPNQKGTLLLLKEALASFSQGLVFYLLVKRVRDLLLVSGQKKPTGSQIWQLRKLQSQVQFFDTDSLERIYRQLLFIDRAQKTGQERFNLKGELEMLILDLK